MKRISFTILFFIAYFGFANSQTSKLAYLNADKVLIDMPEIAAADTQLVKLNKEYNDYVEQLKTNYAQKLKFLQENKETLSNIIFEQKAKELASIEQQIADFQQKAQQDLLKKRDVLYAPIKTKLFAAIEDVRKAKGYTDVLNSSTGLILATDGKNNIEAEVRKKLGLK